MSLVSPSSDHALICPESKLASDFDQKSRVVIRPLANDVMSIGAIPLWGKYMVLETALGTLSGRCIRNAVSAGGGEKERGKRN